MSEDLIRTFRSYELIWVVGETQLNDIISSSEAWTISEDLTEDEISTTGLKPTVSARQVKALIEQITGTFL